MQNLSWAPYFSSGHRCLARGLCEAAFSGKAGAGAKVPGCLLGPTICLTFSTHPSPYMESALHTPHTCLKSPFWICLKLLLLQGWDVLEPPKSTQALPITPPTRSPVPPSWASRATSITDTGLSARPRAPSKARIQNGFIPGGPCYAFMSSIH